MRPYMLYLLLTLQAFHVLFLLLHDWVPLGSLNNVAAVRGKDSFGRLLRVTLISTSFYAYGFVESLIHSAGPFPHWLLLYLLISYLLLFVGELQAWWIPYFGRPQPERAARYQVMFGATHSLLPARNGIPLNTLHVILHITTVATLVVIALGMTR